MVSYRTLSKLTKAQVRALDVGLEQTAERLSILRRRLEDYKFSPERIEDGRIRWVVAKLDDTQETLKREVASQRSNENSSEKDWEKRALAAITKAVTFMATLLMGARWLQDRDLSDDVAGIAGATALSLVAVWTVSKVIDRLIVGRPFEETTLAIERLISDCKSEILKDRAAESGE